MKRIIVILGVVAVCTLISLSYYFHRTVSVDTRVTDGSAEQIAGEGSPSDSAPSMTQNLTMEGTPASHSESQEYEIIPEPENSAVANPGAGNGYNEDTTPKRATSAPPIRLDLLE